MTGYVEKRTYRECVHFSSYIFAHIAHEATLFISFLPIYTCIEGSIHDILALCFVVVATSLCGVNKNLSKRLVSTHLRNATNNEPRPFAVAQQ